MVNSNPNVQPIVISHATVEVLADLQITSWFINYHKLGIDSSILKMTYFSNIRSTALNIEVVLLSSQIWLLSKYCDIPAPQQYHARVPAICRSCLVDSVCVHQLSEEILCIKDDVIISSISLTDITNSFFCLMDAFEPCNKVWANKACNNFPVTVLGGTTYSIQCIDLREESYKFVTIASFSWLHELVSL